MPDGELNDVRLGTCGECDRLWQKYADATKAELKSANVRHLAELRGDDQGLVEATGQMRRAAAEIRRKARQELMDHVATHLAETPPPGD